MNVPDPKTFYDSIMPQKCGPDYEFSRWKSSPLMETQYNMTERTIRSLVISALAGKSSILEIGAGPATWTKVLIDGCPNASYTLVDISREMLERARRALAGVARVSLVESDFTAFSSPKQFDGVFSSRAIEYMPDKEAVVRKIADILLPGAAGALITKMPKRFLNRLRGRFPSKLHRSQIAPHELTSLLCGAGLQILTVRPATATVPLISSALLNRIAFSIIRHLPPAFPFSIFAESYCVVFKKP